MTSRGFLPAHYVSYIKQKPNDSTKLEPLFYEFSKVHEWPTPVSKEYGFISTNWTSLKKAVLLFDNNPEPPNDFPHEHLNRAEIYLNMMLEEMGVKSFVMDLGEVDFNMQASSGTFYQKIYGNKGKFLMTAEGLKEINVWWDCGHKLDFVPLWKVSGKEEILPMEKILSSDQRCFEIPPMPFLASALRLVQGFNKSLYVYRDESPFALGVTYAGGGMNRLVKAIDFENGIKLEGDVKKWDKFFRSILRDACYRIRVKAFNGIGMSREEYADRLRWVYQHCTHGNVLLPWGQVLLLAIGMLSGDPSTTSDNSLAHCLIYFMYVIEHFPGVHGWRDIWKIMRMKLYADDHIGIVNQETHFLSPFDRRAEFYARCGFNLKKDDDKVQESWLGIKFLGAYITKYYLYYVPAYDADRLYAACRIRQSKLKPIELFNKYLSILLMSTFHIELFEYLSKFLHFLVEKFDKKYGITWTSVDQISVLQKFGQNIILGGYDLSIFPPPFVPSHSWCVRFFTGLESGGTYLPSTRYVKMSLKTINKTVTYDGSFDTLAKCRVFEFCAAKLYAFPPDLAFSKMGPDHQPKFTARLVWSLPTGHTFNICCIGAPNKDKGTHQIFTVLDKEMSKLGLEIACRDEAPALEKAFGKMTVVDTVANLDRVTITKKELKEIVEQLEIAFQYMLTTIPEKEKESFDQWLQSMINKLKHAYEGNVNSPRTQRVIFSKIVANIQRDGDKSSYLRVKAIKHNKEQHSLNGNQPNKEEKKKLKREARKLKKKIVKEEMKKQKFKPMKMIPRPRIQQQPMENIHEDQIRSAVSKLLSQGPVPKGGLLKRALEAMLLPKENFPVRWGDTTSRNKCGVAKVFEIIPIPYATGSTGESDRLLDYDTLVAFVFADPLRTCVLYYPNSAAATWKYDLFSLASTEEAAVGISASAPGKAFAMTVFPAEIAPFKLSYAKPASDSAISPHGPILFMGQCKERPQLRWFWMDKGCTISLTADFEVSSANDCAIPIFRWRPQDGVIEIEESMGFVGNAAAVTETYVTGTPGYYSLGARCTGIGGILNVSELFISGAKGVFGHRSFPYAQDHVAQIGNCRITALSALFQNFSPELYKQGLRASALIPPQIHFCDLIDVTNGADLVNTIAASSAGDQDQAKLGGYVWKPPEPQLNPFKTALRLNDEDLSDSFYNLEHDQSYLATAFKISEDTAKSIELCYTAHIEFKTKDLWYDMQTPQMTPRMFERIVEIANGFPVNFENPNHFKNIMRGIIGAVKKYGPTVLKIAETAAPMFL